MDKLTDDELIELLASGDYQPVDEATKIILARGTRMFVLLLQLEGNQKPFEGTLLGNPQASSVTVKPIPGFQLNEELKEKIVTIEVASLYIISAIYHGRLDFAQNPLLTDLSLPHQNRVAANKQEYIIRAFTSVKTWINKCEKEGLESLRKQGEAPLKSSKIGWW